MSDLQPAEEIQLISVEEETVEKKGNDKCQYYALMLYPNEDEKHRLLLDYILKEKSMFPRVLYITHDRDIYTEDTVDAFGVKHLKGEIKKEHTHVLYKFHKRIRLNGMLKHFAGQITFVVPIEDYVVYGHYLLHRTLQAIIEGKPEYNLFEIYGDREFIDEVFIQNTNTAQFMNILRTVKSKNNMFEVFEEFEKQDNTVAIRYCQKHSTALAVMQNQINGVFSKGVNKWNLQ